jgi:hypothetical protein
LNLITRQVEEVEIRIKEKSRASGPDSLSLLSAEEERKVLDSLMEKQTEVQRLVDELYDLHQLQLARNEATQDIQPKFIDVGMILYSKLKIRYQNANKTIRKYTKRRNALLNLRKKVK